MSNETLLNIKQLSKYICLSISTINRMLVARTIMQPTYLLGLNKKRLWKLSSIEKWLDQECSNPKKEAHNV